MHIWHKFHRQAAFRRTYLPTQNYKLRMVNQQTFAHIETKTLTASTIVNSDSPLNIAIKGAAKLSLKIKLFLLEPNCKQKCLGEGAVDLGQSQAYHSFRVIIYDGTFRAQQLAICSIDIFLPETLAAVGQQSRLGKRVDNNKSAVQAPPSQQKSDAGGTIEQDEAFHLDQTLEEQIHEKSQDAQQESSLKRPSKKMIGEDLLAHISQIKKNLSSNISEETPAAIINNKSNNNNSKNSNSHNSTEMHIIEDIMTNRKLMDRIKNFLQGDAVNMSVMNRASKVRRRKFTIDESCLPLNKYIKYHSDKVGTVKVMRGVEVFRLTNNELKEDQSDEINRVDIKKMQILVKGGKDRIVEVDFQLYQHDCSKRAMPALEIKLPLDESALEVELETYHGSIIKGVIGMQQGQHMSVDLHHSQTYEPILTKQSYKLKFEIDDRQSRVLQVEKKGQIRDLAPTVEAAHSARRVSAQCIQPWGYVESHTDNLQQSFMLSDSSKQQQDVSLLLPRLSDSVLQSKLSGKKRKSQAIRSETIVPRSSSEAPHYKPDHSRRSLTIQRMLVKNKPKSSKMVDKMVQADHGKKEAADIVKKISNARLYFTEEEASRHQLKEEQKWIKELKSYRKSKLKKVYETSSSNIDEASEILNIRNGNRTNHKYGQINSQTMKKLWERLLIGRKVEMDLEARQAKEDNSIRGVISNWKKKDRSRYLERPSIIKQNESSIELKNSPREFDVRKKSRHLSNIEPHRVVLADEESSDSKAKHERLTRASTLRELTLEVKNISVAGQSASVRQDERLVGKFLKIGVEGKAMYYTEVMFGESSSSVLWKVEGCEFTQLTGNEKLLIELYETEDNAIRLMGEAKVRLNKLYFIRKQHLYNSQLRSYDGSKADEALIDFTMGFQLSEYLPFEVIEEEEEELTENKFSKRGKDKGNYKGH